MPAPSLGCGVIDTNGRSHSNDKPGEPGDDEGTHTLEWLHDSDISHSSSWLTAHNILRR